MKKLLAMLLALTLVLSMGVAMASDDVETDSDSEYEMGGTIKLPKHYTLVNPGMTSPSDTFVFNITPDHTEKSDCPNTAMPDIQSTVSIPFAEGRANTPNSIDPENPVTAAKELGNITIPTFDLPGIYYYKITEQHSNNAGVKIEEGKVVWLVFVITQNSESEDGKPLEVKVANIYYESADGKSSIEDNDAILFENKYAAGNLNITKSVSGLYGDNGKYFDIYVTLTAPENTYTTSNTEDKLNVPALTVTGGSYTGNPSTITANGQSVTFKIKHDETLIIKNIPYDVSYTVEEESYAPTYVTTYTGGDTVNTTVVEGTTKQVNVTGTLDAVNESITISNFADGDPETGISLDDLPYIILLAVAVLGIAALLLKKRFAANHD